jgi:hypothetical protein
MSWEAGDRGWGVMQRREKERGTGRVAGVGALIAKDSLRRMRAAVPGSLDGRT